MMLKARRIFRMRVLIFSKREYSERIRCLQLNDIYVYRYMRIFRIRIVRIFRVMLSVLSWGIFRLKHKRVYVGDMRIFRIGSVRIFR